MSDILVEKSPHEVSPSPRVGRASAVSLVLAVSSLILLAPAAPALWSSARHWRPDIAIEGPGDAGHVTITHCSRGPLLVAWSCRGTFRIEDAYDGDDLHRNVVVTNDFQHRSVGEVVGVNNFNPRVGTAYYWDSQYVLVVFAALAGAILCVVGIGGILRQRRRRTDGFAHWVALLGVVLILPVFLTFAGLISTQAAIPSGITSR